jgi:hypothetical protein
LLSKDEARRIAIKPFFDSDQSTLAQTERRSLLKDGDETLGEQNDPGSTVPSTTFRIRSLTLNNIVIEDVQGNVAPVAGELLLGQSFLARFKSWSIDNAKQAC